MKKLLFVITIILLTTTSIYSKDLDLNQNIEDQIEEELKDIEIDLNKYSDKITITLE